MTTRRFNIRDEQGTLVAVHGREDHRDGSKGLWWEQPDGTKHLDRPVTSLPLYGSEEVQFWPTSETVVVTEGEKAMEALAAIGFCSLATYGCGANPTSDAIGSVAKGRTFVLWPDLDQPGWKHMDKVADVLYDAGATKVFVLDLRGLDRPKGSDAADFVPPIPSPPPEGMISEQVERIRILVNHYAHVRGRRPIPPPMPARIRVRPAPPANGRETLDVAWLRSRLQSVKPLSGGYKAKCPAHEDDVASLSFREGHSAPFVIRCHAGCSFEQIMAALS